MDIVISEIEGVAGSESTYCLLVKSLEGEEVFWQARLAETQAKLVDARVAQRMLHEQIATAHGQTIKPGDMLAVVKALDGAYKLVVTNA